MLLGNGAFFNRGGGGGGGPVTDPHFANVVLLCGFEGADGATSAVDESNSAHTLTFAGNAQIDTADSVFGGGSLLLDGTGDYVSIPDSADWHFGTGPFTVECWWKQDGDVVTTGMSIISQYDTSSSQRSFEIQWNRQAGSIRNLNFRVSGDGTAFVTLGAVGSLSGVSAANWIHYAIDRDSSGVFRGYRNGVMVAKDAANTSLSLHNSSSPLRIGGRGDGTSLCDGWHDEVRITKVSRYGDVYGDTSFTPPAAAFPRA